MTGVEGGDHSGLKEGTGHFRLLEVVLVTSLRTHDRPVHGSTGFVRQPQVGDYGTVVEILGEGLGMVYIVECVDKAGMTVWLGDFHGDELEAVRVDYRVDRPSTTQTG